MLMGALAPGRTELRHRRLAQSAFLIGVVVAVATGCNPTAPSLPTSIAGAWVSDVQGGRIRMELTEGPSGIGPSWFNVTGSGSLTAVGTRVTLRPDGSNVKLSASSTLQHSILINFFPTDGGGVAFGFFTGDLNGADMVGILERG